MNIFIPVSSVMKTTDGLSVFGTLPSTPFISKLASDWTEYRDGLKEAGYAGTVGSIPQIRAESGMISVQAFIKEANAQSKFQLGVLRGFNLDVDTINGQITQVVACDRGADDGPEAIKLYKKATMNGQQMMTDLRRTIKDEVAAFRKEVFPATGTSTDSRGPERGDQSGPNPNAIDAATMMARYVEEFETAFVELGEKNVDGNLSPAEIVAQAKRIALQNLKSWAATVTDRSNDNGSDPSLAPTSQAAAAAAAQIGLGASPIAGKSCSTPSGHELSKRLLASINSTERVGVGGGADSMLKSAESFAIRKVDDDNALNISKEISTPEELAARLSARDSQGLRKSADASILNFPDEQPGTYNPMLSNYNSQFNSFDPYSELVNKLNDRSAPGTSLEKLLH